MCTSPRKSDAFSIRPHVQTLKPDTWGKYKQPTATDLNSMLTISTWNETYINSPVTSFNCEQHNRYGIFKQAKQFPQQQISHTNVPHQPHNWVFLFLMNTTSQTTIHTQPPSSNILVQHEKHIMTQHGTCKDTDNFNYIKQTKKKEERISTWA